MTCIPGYATIAYKNGGDTRLSTNWYHYRHARQWALIQCRLWNDAAMNEGSALERCFRQGKPAYIVRITRVKGVYETRAGKEPVYTSSRSVIDNLLFKMGSMIGEKR